MAPEVIHATTYCPEADIAIEDQATAVVPDVVDASHDFPYVEEYHNAPLCTHPT